MQRDTDVSRLHRLSLEVDPQAPKSCDWLDRRLAAIAYRVTAMRQTRKYYEMFGEHVREKYGVSRAQQRRDLWHCMWRHNQCARHYYWRKLFLIQDRAVWLENFEHRQVNTLLDHLNSQVPAKRISHKVQFAEHCRIHNLNTPANVAVWEQGGRLVTPAPANPRTDLFIKPTADFGSVGTMTIGYDDAADKYRMGTALLAWPELLERIAKNHTRHTGYVMQRRLRNSTGAAVYGHEDVCNLRLVTGKSVHGEPELIAAVIRLPSSYTTQGHDRNVLLANVDVRSGIMGPGVFRNIKLPEFTHHPDTGFPIQGRPLPNWSGMVELALGAHRTCPWMPFVGWDVVDSDQGLILLEANANWGGDSAQLPGAPGLGATRFPAIYFEWFEHLRSFAPAPSRTPALGQLELAEHRN
jgi:hypothetical protein